MQVSRLVKIPCKNRKSRDSAKRLQRSSERERQIGKTYDKQGFLSKVMRLEPRPSRRLGKIQEDLARFTQTGGKALCPSCSCEKDPSGFTIWQTLACPLALLGCGMSGGG